MFFFIFMLRFSIGDRFNIFLSEFIIFFATMCCLLI